MIASFDDVLTTASLTEAREELMHGARDLIEPRRCGDFTVAIKLGTRSLWAVAMHDDGAGVALRVVRSWSTPMELRHISDGHDVELELACSLGTYRASVTTARRDDGTVMLHGTSSFLPLHDLKLEPGPRDLYPIGLTSDPLEIDGCVHAAQRGLRTGIVFGSATSRQPLSFFYFQDFSALSRYYDDTESSPKDTVGGEWPELGYSAPPGAKPLRAANEYVLSDAYVFLTADVPISDDQAAGLYLDLLAQAYMVAQKPRSDYHHWPAVARETVLHLSQAPGCTYVRKDGRYVTPYVGDNSKPPESMVQLVMLLALLEYERWSGEDISLVGELVDNLPRFFDERIGCVVRWLPEQRFSKSNDPGQTHDAMDSWYLYHVLFNLSRLSKRGVAHARDLLERSLPYAVRVAQRFSYRWPIFFDLTTLDIVRAEAEPGRGGENDVAGLYALIMLHASEIFGDPSYVDEAKRAIEALDGLGFRLAYQMNTTLFGAEAAMRLFALTGEPRYLRLSEICIANAMNNVWMWECMYGYARAYPTFFGLFPLQDAPYLAAYEELEAIAKFREYFKIGGDRIRPAVRLLLAEYCKHMLQRGHYYYPASLPPQCVATKSTNGAVERTVAVPLEDLRDGREQSGQVGQETYGAGLSMVCTTRHYLPIDGLDVTLYCEYPAFGFKETGGRPRNGARTFEFRIEGDERMRCDVRFIPTGFGRPYRITLYDGEDGAELKADVTPEGHTRFAPRGNRWVDVTIG